VDGSVIHFAAHFLELHQGATVDVLGVFPRRLLSHQLFHQGNDFRRLRRLVLPRSEIDGSVHRSLPWVSVLSLISHAEE